MLSAFQSIIPAQLNVRQIMSPSENFLKDALTLTQTRHHRRACKRDTALRARRRDEDSGMHPIRLSGGLPRRCAATNAIKQ